MRPRLAALDLSLTATGAAWCHNPRQRPGRPAPAPIGVRTISPATTGHERLRDILLAVADVCRIHPQLVTIERPFIKTDKATIPLIELHALVKQWLWVQGIPYVYIGPMTRAVYATGDGHANKATVTRAVRLAYGHLLGGPSGVGDHNQADALTMLAMTLDAYGHPLDVEGYLTPVLPDRHRRAVKSVGWPHLEHPPPGDAGREPAARRGPRLPEMSTR